MQALAALPDAEGGAALCRLVRFENASRLSKTAAVALLADQTAADPPRAAVDRSHPQESERLQAARAPSGCLTWSRLSSEPGAVMSEWGKLSGQ